MCGGCRVLVEGVGDLGIQQFTHPAFVQCGGRRAYPTDVRMLETDRLDAAFTKMIGATGGGFGAVQLAREFQGGVFLAGTFGPHQEEGLAEFAGLPHLLQSGKNGLPA